MRGVTVAAMLLAAPPLGAQPPRGDIALADRMVRSNRALATCELSLQIIDRARLDSVDLQASGERTAAEHARVRGGAFTPPADAEIVLSIYAGASHTQNEPTETSSYVWKGADGAWRVDRMDYRPRFSPQPQQAGQAPLGPAELEAARRTPSTGHLAPEQAAEIEAALADPCLAAQPDYVPTTVPWPDGRSDNCWGGVGGLIEIRRGARVRRIADSCARWAAGRLMREVMYARAGPAWPSAFPPVRVVGPSTLFGSGRSPRDVAPVESLPISPGEAGACLSRDAGLLLIGEFFQRGWVPTRTLQPGHVELTQRPDHRNFRASFHYFRAIEEACGEGRCLVVRAARIEAPVRRDYTIDMGRARNRPDAFTARMLEQARGIASRCRPGTAE